MEFVARKVFTHVQNHCDLLENFNLLKRKLEELNAVKEDNESVKSIEQLQPRKRLKRVVQYWFQEVERINKDICSLENGVRGSSVLSFAGEKVINKINEVDKLLQQGKNFDVLVLDDPQWIGQILSTTTLSGEVPKKLMEQIWDYLMDDSVSKIGVWGMGGIGKTTIMKLIHNQLVKEAKKFNKVIWITISKEINITKLQNDIAREMYVPLFEDDDDDEIRAGKLYQSLTKLAIEGKYVIILDDLWANLSLEDIGIPEPSDGSKLVITTRSLDVCHYLDCVEVRIPILPQLDAQSLFLETVGKDIIKYPDLLPLVKSIADECDGLPLAIVTIGGSMKKVRDIPTWRNALHELKGQVKSVSGMNEEIFQKLQFSYDRLGDEKLKRCFLCCALYPEDFNIDTNELISLWIAEGYVEEMDSMQVEIDRGYAVLNKLKKSCLIEEGTYEENTVKLHDIVRDMVLHITSARPRFLVKAGMQLKKIPDAREWKEDLEKVSLMSNWGLHIPLQMSPPNCPLLTTLLLSHCEIESIPHRFFEQLRGLKILDLSATYITSLPNSLSDVESLTTLLLRGCCSLKEIPSLSKLKALKKLDLFETGIEEFPNGINELINLRYLNLSFTPIRKMDLGILANLTSLLHLEIIPYYSGRREFELGGRLGIELLVQLEFLEMSFNELQEFNCYTQALEEGRVGEGPCHYKIIVSNEAQDIMYVAEEKFILFKKSVICTENIKLPSNVETLEFRDIMNGREDEVFFSNLITCSGNVSFSSLKRIELRYLKAIRKLFSLGWVLHNLHNLEFLEVGGHHYGYDLQLMDIIGSESKLDLEEEPVKYCTLVRLRVLRLWGLPALKNICSDNVSIICNSIEDIHICDCPKLKRIPIIFPLGHCGLPSPPPSLKRILAYPKEWWESAEWYQPNVKSVVKHLVNYSIPV